MFRDFYFALSEFFFYLTDGVPLLANHFLAVFMALCFAVMGISAWYAIDSLERNSKLAWLYTFIMLFTLITSVSVPLSQMAMLRQCDTATINLVVPEIGYDKTEEVVMCRDRNNYYGGEETYGDWYRTNL